METKIRAKLEELRNMLKADGGDMDIVSIEDTHVSLRLKGACGCCPHAAQTLKQGIERVLQEEVNETITVLQVK